MDNNGYSNNNESYQGEGNNLYPNGPTQETKRTKGIFLLGLLGGIAISTLLTALVYVGGSLINIHTIKNAAPVSTEGAATEDVFGDDTLAKMKTIRDVIDQYYYNEDDIDPENMVEWMYDGMIASLGDPYSVYYTEKEWADMMEATKGIYYGIGAYVSLDTNTGLTRISGVIAGTPAEEAGLRENDLIYLIDGEETTGHELSEVASRMKGEEGTKVHLTIYREGESDYLEVDVIRGKIEAPTVSYEMLGEDIGYIAITEFDDVTVEQFTEALAVIKGSDAKGLILDLRSNPGGSLASVVDIARQILPKGLIVYTEDKNGKREKYNCDGKNKIQIPLVVLINQNSASASEILAGAVKDYGIGELVGMKTFGKGIVQRILPLNDGTALKLTVSAYYTPKGNNIHNIGIEPDIECELDADAYYNDGIDSQLNRAIEEVRKMIG